MDSTSEQNFWMWMLTAIFVIILVVSSMVLIIFYSIQDSFYSSYNNVINEIKARSEECAKQVAYWEERAKGGQKTPQQEDMTACKQLASWAEELSVPREPSPIFIFSVLLGFVLLGGVWIRAFLLCTHLSNRYEALKFKYENLRASYERFVKQCSSGKVKDDVETQV